MTNNFLKLSLNQSNSKQMDALKDIAKKEGVYNKDFDAMNKLSAFEGNLENFQGLMQTTGYDATQIESIFNAINIDGDDTLSQNEISMLAGLGEGDSTDKANDYNLLIDASDIEALYTQAFEAVEQGLTEALADEAIDGVETAEEVDTEASKNVMALDTKNTGVEYNEETGEYTVTIEDYSNNKLNDNGNMRYTNGSYWGIVTNAYPDATEGQKEQIYKMIAEANNWEEGWENHSLYTGDKVILPQISFDSNGNMQVVDSKPTTTASETDTTTTTDTDTTTTTETDTTTTTETDTTTTTETDTTTTTETNTTTTTTETGTADDSSKKVKSTEASGDQWQRTVKTTYEDGSVVIQSTSHDGKVLSTETISSDGKTSVKEFADGRIQTKNYNDDGKITSSKTTKDGKVIESYEYAYDKNGQIASSTIQITNADGSKVNTTITYENGKEVERDVQEISKDGVAYAKLSEYNKYLEDISKCGSPDEKIDCLNGYLNNPNYKLSEQQRADLITDVISSMGGLSTISEAQKIALGNNINDVLLDLKELSQDNGLHLPIEFAEKFKEANNGVAIHDFMKSIEVDDNDLNNVRSEFARVVTILYGRADENLDKVLEQFPITEAFQHNKSGDNETDYLEIILSSTLDDVKYDGKSERLNQEAKKITSAESLIDLLSAGGEYTDIEKAQILSQMDPEVLTSYIREMHTLRDNNTEEIYLSALMHYVAQAVK